MIRRRFQTRYVPRRVKSESSTPLFKGEAPYFGIPALTARCSTATAFARESLPAAWRDSMPSASQFRTAKLLPKRSAALGIARRLAHGSHRVRARTLLVNSPAAGVFCRVFYDF
jgi:hypothetical protein